MTDELRPEYDLIIKNSLCLLKRDFVISQVDGRFLVIPIEFHEGEYIANFTACGLDAYGGRCLTTALNASGHDMPLQVLSNRKQHGGDAVARLVSRSSSGFFLCPEILRMRSVL